MCFSLQVDKDLKKLSRFFNAEILNESFDNFQNLQKKMPKRFKECDANNRIYPNYFAPIITIENNKRIIQYMRYRIRPNKSKEEAPSKYNLYNARLDSLEKRVTWKKLFMHKHALCPFIQFYEWLPYRGKKKLGCFKPDQLQFMWAPCLYDHWCATDNSVHFHSFAIITGDPPLEVKQKGHDRCPIFIQEEMIDSWLMPEKQNKQEIYGILKEKTNVHYVHSWI